MRSATRTGLWLGVPTGVLLLLAAVASPTGFTAGGLLELYSWPEDSVNLVKNPSFEDVDKAGQPTGWRGWPPENFRLTTAEARSGSRSLEMRDSKGARNVPSMEQPLALEPGLYTLRGWIKARDAGGPNAEAGARYGLRGGASKHSTPVVRGTFDWTRFEVRNIAIEPTRSKGAVITEAYGRPAGSFFFDDLELRRHVPPLLEAFLRYPNYRGLLFDDRPQTIVASVTLRPEVKKLSLADLGVRARVTREDKPGVDVLTSETTPSRTSLVLSLDASSLPHGSYRLVVDAIRRGTQTVVFAYPPYRIVKLPGAARNTMRVLVDADQTLILGGRRVFPIGIFDTSGASPDPKFWEPRFRKIAEAPMSIYINYHQGNEGEAVLKALMEAAQRYGIFYLHTTNAWYEEHRYFPRKMVCEGRTGEALKADGLAGCVARRLRDHPGLAGWYMADEAPAGVVERVFHQYRILRENTTAGIGLIAQNAPNELGRWRDSSDVFAVDPFPLWGNYPEGTLAPLEMVTNWLETAQAGVERSRPVWGDIQFFRATAAGRWPTRDDLRTMSYMAIVAGARGLIYWSYGARALAWVKDPALREQYWQRLVSVTKEIKSLEPVLLSPDAPDILVRQAPAAAVRVLAKRVGATRYLITVNNTPKEVEASFTLAEPAGAVEVLGERRTLQFGGATLLTDGFAPYAVHVYKLEGAAAAK